jgi:hypothetical protein
VNLRGETERRERRFCTKKIFCKVNVEVIKTNPLPGRGKEGKFGERQIAANWRERGIRNLEGSLMQK